VSDPRDTRSRLVDPFNSPEDYADPWRGRKTPILLVCLGLIVLAFVVLFFLV
jgi:hypothetical protein